MSQDSYNSYFNIFSNCLLVKGIKRSLIVDTQREDYHIIPNDLYEILVKTKRVKLNQIFSEYGDDNFDVIQDYFYNLIKLELGFYLDELEIDLFPDLSLEYVSPFFINNCVVEELYSIEYYKKIIPELENLGCEYLEIVLYNSISNKELFKILNLFDKTSIKHIGLIVKYDLTKDLDLIKLLTFTNLRLSKIIFHTHNDEYSLDFRQYNLTDVVFTKIKITNYNFCGNIKSNYFTTNTLHFTESQNYNTCLNKKISIDKNGDIRNCPAMPEGFGNIKDTTLEEALNKSNFKKYWNINKDQISVCKDCEFRHVCTDCRAFTEDPEDQYAKPLKCGYSPYTNVWEEWSTNPLKQKAIEYYGM